MRSTPNASPFAQALGYGGPHFPLANHYAREGEEWMYGRGSHDKLTESGDWREKIVLTEHRYMLEDVGIGLSFLASVAALAGVATPLARAFLALGSTICDEDFMRTGRSLANLGLGELSIGDLKALLAEGLSVSTPSRHRLSRRRPHGARHRRRLRLCRSSRGHR